LRTRIAKIYGSCPQHTNWSCCNNKCTLLMQYGWDHSGLCYKRVRKLKPGRWEIIILKGLKHVFSSVIVMLNVCFLVLCLNICPCLMLQMELLWCRKNVRFDLTIKYNLTWSHMQYLTLSAELPLINML